MPTIRINSTVNEIYRAAREIEKRAAMNTSLMKIIDADVHPWISGDIECLKPYLSKCWQMRFDGKRSILPDHPLRPPLAGATSIRRDAKTPDGGVGGSD